MKTWTLLLAGLLPFAFADVCSEVTARPNQQGSICERPGSVVRPAYLGKSTVITSDPTDRAEATCRNTCLEIDHCQAYSYNRQTGDCQKYGRKLALQQFRYDATSNVFFTGRTCFVNNFTTSDGFVNSDFESAGKFLKPWIRQSANSMGGPSNVLPMRIAPGYNSSHGVLLSVGGQTGVNTEQIYQRFDLCPNVTYDIAPVYRFLGPADTSVSALRFELGTSEIQPNGECGAYETIYLRPGDANKQQEWSFLYNGNCGTKNFTLNGGRGSTSFIIKFSASYYLGDNSQDPKPLDQYEVDLFVTKRTTPVEDTPLYCNGIAYAPNCCNRDEFGLCCQPDENGKCCALEDDNGNCCKPSNDYQCCPLDDNGDCCTTDDYGNCCKTDENGNCCTTDDNGDCCTQIDQNGQCCQYVADGYCCSKTDDGQCCNEYGSCCYPDGNGECY